jgi:hypothetical protein
MITDKQREFLRMILDGEISKENVPKKYSATMTRIQRQIDRGITNLLWLAEKCPDILMDERSEIDDANLERFRRFKAFAYILSKLNPEMQMEKMDLGSIMDKMSKLFPEYYFELTKMKYLDGKRKGAQG